jgi:hypothetical protein
VGFCAPNLKFAVLISRSTRRELLAIQSGAAVPFLNCHDRRLTRLTNAFSKNFKATVALHFGYYHKETSPLVETFQGNVVWQGAVSTFSPRSSLLFATG